MQTKKRSCSSDNKKTGVSKQISPFYDKTWYLELCTCFCQTIISTTSSIYQFISNYSLTKPDISCIVWYNRIYNCFYDISRYLSDFSIDSLFLDFLRAWNLYKRDDLRSGTFIALCYHLDTSFSAEKRNLKNITLSTFVIQQQKWIVTSGCS